jgi:hypothetical protein
MLRLGAGLLVLVAVAVLWVANCSGPTPQVRDVQLLAPTTDGAPYRVQATVANTGRGQGEVTVIVRLRDQQTGRTIETDRQVELEEHETTLVIADMPAPPGTYTPTVEVEYPPR